MLILSDFVCNDDAIWTKIHVWVTNSTVHQLLRRLILFSSDIYTISEIKGHNEIRAREIASNRTCLYPLIGRILLQLPDEPFDPEKMFQLYDLLIPRWRQISKAFQQMNTGLLEFKYFPSPDDPFYRPGSNPLDLIQSADATPMGLQKHLMPMPALAVLVPRFRYLPLSDIFISFVTRLTLRFRRMPLAWVVMANELAVVIDVKDAAVIALLGEANESLFASYSLTTQSLQMFGIFRGKYTV